MDTPDITYDRYGRMNYHPDIHVNHSLPWTTMDEQYLIDMYEKVGPEQLSFELGRTIGVVMTRAYELRKKGLMPKRTTHRHFPRTGANRVDTD